MVMRSQWRLYKVDPRKQTPIFRLLEFWHNGPSERWLGSDSHCALPTRGLAHNLKQQCTVSRFSFVMDLTNKI